MALEVTSGMLTILVLAAGIKVAIYIGVAIMALLIDMVARKDEKQHMHGLNIMAYSFVAVGLLEFFHVLAVAYGAFPALASHETLDLIVHPLYIVGGLGLVWFLHGVGKNIKEYR